MEYIILTTFAIAALCIWNRLKNNSMSKKAETELLSSSQPSESISSDDFICFYLGNGKSISGSRGVKVIATKKK